MTDDPLRGLDIRKKLANIDQRLLANIDQRFADYDCRRQEVGPAPWMVAIIMITAMGMGAALFAAGMLVAARVH
jgi:hypothetical protein